MPRAFRRAEKRGTMPVASKSPSTAPVLSRPLRLKRKISLSVIVSPSMPSTSLSATRRRLPSSMRSVCTITLIAEAICVLTALAGSSMPAMATMFSTRDSASRGVLACTVVSEPSWPVFMACSMSNASPLRTSPRMIRSGRMRSALRTRSR